MMESSKMIITSGVERRDFKRVLGDIGVEILDESNMELRHIDGSKEYIWLYKLELDGEEFAIDLMLMPELSTGGGVTIGDYMFTSDDGDGLRYDVEYLSGDESELMDLLGKTSDLVYMTIKAHEYDGSDGAYNTFNSIYENFNGIFVEDDLREESTKAYFNVLE